MRRPRHLEGELVTSRRGVLWVGDETVSLTQGTVPRGQMFVQWEAPATVKKPYPIVQTHGGGGRATDWPGRGMPSGWATFLPRRIRGYVDRPDTAAPFHPDVLGPMGSPGRSKSPAALHKRRELAGAHPTADLHTQWREAATRSVRSVRCRDQSDAVDLSAAQAVERERGRLLDEIDQRS
jgi:hypothetical protein